MYVILINKTLSVFYLFTTIVFYSILYYFLAFLGLAGFFLGFLSFHSFKLSLMFSIKFIISPAIAGNPNGVHSAAITSPIKPSLKLCKITSKYTLYTESAKATTDNNAPPIIVKSVKQNATTSNTIINGKAIMFFKILIILSSFFILIYQRVIIHELSRNCK